MAEVQSKPTHQPRSRKGKRGVLRGLGGRRCTDRPNGLCSRMLTNRAGCLTCRSKKVKCDEQAPRCRRCNRLDLTCEWAAPGKLRPNAKAKRSALAKILPKVPPRSIDIGSNSNLYGLQEMWNEAVNGPSGHRLEPAADNELPITACYNTDTIPMWDDWYQELGFTADFLDMGSINAAEQLQDSPKAADAQAAVL